MRKGDLAYVPSEVLLYQVRDEGSMKHYHKLSKPSSVVVINKEINAYRVFFEGQTWFVDSKYLYPMEELDSGNGKAHGSV